MLRAGRLRPFFCASPSSGFRYLYVTPADYTLLVQGGKASIRATLTHDEGEDRYRVLARLAARERLGAPHRGSR